MKTRFESDLERLESQCLYVVERLDELKDLILRDRARRLNGDFCDSSSLHKVRVREVVYNQVGVLLEMERKVAETVDNARELSSVLKVVGDE